MRHPFLLKISIIASLTFISLHSFSQVITTLAGNGLQGSAGDGGAATSAALSNAQGVAVDAAGNVYIADGGNYKIRKVSTTGIITTIAGTGIAGFSGDGGQATAANINTPFGIVVDASGNVIFSDNTRIRKISTTGIITTIAGDGTAGYSGDGGLATAARITAYGMAFDGAGNLFFADAGTNRIRKIATNGIISTVAGTGTAGYSGDGGLATSANLNVPIAVAVDASGNIYIGDLYNYRVRKITSGIISTFAGNGTNGSAGDGGSATAASLGDPSGLAIDGSGNIYVSQRYA